MTSESENPYQAPRAEVRNAPRQRRQAVPATRLIRLAAYVLDFLIWMLPVLPMLIAVLAGGIASGFDDMSAIGPFMVAGVLISFALMIGLFIYQLVLLAGNGWTLGKKICSIRIVRTDGRRAGLGRIFWLRMVLPGFIGFLLNLPPLIIGGAPENLGSVFALVDALFIFGATRRCLHDYMADTIVVRA